MEPLSRFDRIIAIHIQLQSKQVVKAQDLAERFQVSLRTIYRDIRSLGAAGVPIIGEAGQGYSLVEGYRLPPVMFTREEAVSFIAAETLMRKFGDKNMGETFETAILKIRSVLRSQEKEWVAAIESRIGLHSEGVFFEKEIPNALEIILDSLGTKTQVSIDYQAFHADQSTLRMIEPVGLFHEDSHWHLIAYCHLRQDYRQFRTDRIKGIEKTTLAHTRTHKPLDEYRNSNQDTPPIVIKLVMHKTIVKYLIHSAKYYGFVSQKEEGDQVEMTFHCTGDMDGFARWYVMLGDHVRILEPEALKSKVRNMIKEISKQLGDD